MEAKRVFDETGLWNIKVRTKSGAEYVVHKDSIEVGSDDWRSDDAYVYGERTNGTISLRGRRRVDTRGQTKWFLLSNCTYLETVK